MLWTSVGKVLQVPGDVPLRCYPPRPVSSPAGRVSKVSTGLFASTVNRVVNRVIEPVIDGALSPLAQSGID
jgi:hypothetical protein